jgi:hypothetical protein
MHDSGAAVAEPDDAPLLRIGGTLPLAPLGGSSTSAGIPQSLPGLLDTRLVRLELTRRRMPRQGSQTVGLARVRTARSQGTTDDGHAR